MGLFDWFGGMPTAVKSMGPLAWLGYALKPGAMEEATTAAQNAPVIGSGFKIINAIPPGGKTSGNKKKTVKKTKASGVRRKASAKRRTKSKVRK